MVAVGQLDGADRTLNGMIVYWQLASGLDHDSLALM